MEAVRILYTNWKGERGWRLILPRELPFKSTEFHPEEQYILEAWDFIKQADRSFAMRDIELWVPTQTILPGPGNLQITITCSGGC